MMFEEAFSKSFEKSGCVDCVVCEHYKKDCKQPSYPPNLLSHCEDHKEGENEWSEFLDSARIEQEEIEFFENLVS